MAKIEMPLTAYAYETSRVFGKTGCLLVAGNMKESNVMTIGWGTIGMLWGKSVFIVFVRPSRHTHGLMDKHGEFTVNVPKKGMEDFVAYCGKVSGRDENKFKAKGVDIEKGRRVSCPVITDCPINYECKTIYKTRINPDAMSKEALNKWYPKGDFHTIYFGEIVSVSAEKDAASELPI